MSTETKVKKQWKTGLPKKPITLASVFRNRNKPLFEYTQDDLDWFASQGKPIKEKD